MPKGIPKEGKRSKRGPRIDTLARELVERIRKEVRQEILEKLGVIDRG